MSGSKKPSPISPELQLISMGMPSLVVRITPHTRQKPKAQLVRLCPSLRRMRLYRKALQRRWAERYMEDEELAS